MKRSLLTGLGPRDRAAAARAGGRLTLVGAAITAVFALVYPPAGGTSAQISALAVPAALVVFTVVLRRVSSGWPGIVWLLLPVLGLVAITSLDLVTRDGSAAGQVFLCYPTLYAASQLRRAGAVVAVATAIAADAVVVVALLPPQPAVTDFCYVTATLLAMTMLLVRGAEAQEKLVDALRAQAAIDPLTGLVTRRVLDEAAQSAMRGAAEGAGTAMVLMDVDRFKSINDTHGHPVGDAVLVHIAAILVANSRSNSVSCRMGGDELAILLPGCTSDSAVRRAQQFLDAIRSTPLELSDGTLLAVSVSLGVAHMPSHAEGLLELYQAADEALYEAKRRGRGTVAVAPPGTARLGHVRTR